MTVEAPMLTVLERLVTNTSAVFRLLWSATAALEIALSSGQSPLGIGHALALVAGFLSAACFVSIARRGGQARVLAALADLGLSIVLLMTAGGLLVPAAVGDITTWVFLSASVSALIAVWTLPLIPALLATSCLVGSYFVGVAVAGQSWRAHHVHTAMFLLLQAVLGLAVLMTVRKAVRRADQALARRLATEQVYRLQRELDSQDRERERTIHDEVRAALVLVAGGWLNDRVGHARTLCRAALAALGKLADGRIDAGTETGLDDLGRRLATAAEDLGLIPRVTRRHPQGDRASDVPPVVLHVIEAAAREALRNVREHASIGKVEISVVTEASAVAITVTDHGVGFNVTRAGARGISDSIVGRMTEICGAAEVVSAAGQGTSVHLTWRGVDQLIPHRKAVAVATVFYRRGFYRAVAFLALVFHAQALYFLLSFRHDYRSVPLALACWAAIGAVGAVLYFGAGSAWMSRSRARMAAAVILTASVGVTLNCRPTAVLGFANWALGSSGWVLALTAAYSPLTETLVTLACVFVLNGLIIVPILGPEPEASSRLVGNALGVSLMQAGTAIAFSMARRASASMAAEAWTAGVATARADAEGQARERHRARFAELDSRLVDLFTGIAEGRVDPSESSVRQRCLASIAALHRADVLAGITDVDGDLSALARDCAQRGVVVEYTFVDNPASLDRVAWPLLRKVIRTALSTAAPGSAQVTFVAGNLVGKNSADDGTSFTVSCRFHTLTTSASLLDSLQPIVGGIAVDVERQGIDAVWIAWTLG